MNDIKFKVWVKTSKKMKQWDEIKDDLKASELVSDKCFTFLQYTGVKSFDGKEIYQGDIVTPINQKKKYTVSWGMNGWVFFDGWEITAFITGDLEVIGNVFENPNLWNGQ